jgi:hypothetical protein
MVVAAVGGRFSTKAFYHPACPVEPWAVSVVILENAMWASG